MKEFRAMEIKDKCVAWIRDFFEKNGKGCNCIIGISGGKDSSVAAALCVEALGKDRVIGVLMPNGEQSDIDVAKRLVEFLGITGITVNIGPIVQAAAQGVQTALAEKVMRKISAFSYEVLDNYIRTGEIEDAAVKEKIDRLHEKNLFKLQLMPKFTESEFTEPEL